MKRLVLFIFMLGSILSVQSQAVLDDYTNSDVYDKPSTTAGYLEKAGRQFNTSITFGTVGCIGASVLIYNEDTRIAGYCVGGFCLVISYITRISAGNNLKKAGIQLQKENSSRNRDGAYIEPSKEGIGLCLRF